MKFREPGVGFVGFEFDRGDGFQSGGARIKKSGERLVTLRRTAVAVDYLLTYSRTQ